MSNFYRLKSPTKVRFAEESVSAWAIDNIMNDVADELSAQKNMYQIIKSCNE